MDAKHKQRKQIDLKPGRCTRLILADGRIITIHSGYKPGKRGCAVLYLSLPDGSKITNLLDAGCCGADTTPMAGDSSLAPDQAG